MISIIFSFFIKKTWLDELITCFIVFNQNLRCHFLIIKNNSWDFFLSFWLLIDFLMLEMIYGIRRKIIIVFFSIKLVFFTCLRSFWFINKIIYELFNFNSLSKFQNLNFGLKKDFIFKWFMIKIWVYLSFACFILKKAILFC